MKMIEMKGIYKKYPSPEKAKEVLVLKDLDLTVEKGEFTAIMGESGAGKSTLMNIIGTMDLPDEGYYRLGETDISTLSAKQLSKFRSRKIGFIFQNSSLMPALTALENVKLPLSYQGMSHKAQNKRAEDALRQMRLSDRTGHLPGQLSGGQRQRVAIARAIAADPDVILADEPTGSLDASSGKEVMSALTALHQMGKTILLITHDPKAAMYADRILFLQNGRLYEKNHGIA